MKKKKELGRFIIAVKHDPNWIKSFRKSWKVRRYWLARPDVSSKSKAKVGQYGPWTLKVIYG